MAYISNSELALKNDERELMSAFDPEIVDIVKVEAPVGVMVKYRVRVNAPTHYLENDSTDNPIACDSIVFYIEVLNAYPNTRPKVYYPSNKRLASVNVYLPDPKDGMRSAQCTDKWKSKGSSLFLLVEKTVRDIIHDPSVCRYDSMANDKLKDWHERNVANKIFPTIEPGDIYRKSSPADNSRAVRLPPPARAGTVRRKLPPPRMIK